jgi:hypothetical protein
VVFTTQIQWGYDFSAYWTAGAHLLAGDPIYSAAQLAGPYAPQQQYLYLYPPPLAGFAAPWTAFGPADYRLAAWGWTALGAAILVTTILAIARSEGLMDRVRTRPAWGDGSSSPRLGFPPVIGELVLGNVHLFLLGLLGGPGSASAAERRATSGSRASPWAWPRSSRSSPGSSCCGSS